MVKTTTFLEKYFTTVISIIEDRLYFTYLTKVTNGSIKSDDEFHYFTMDKRFIYNSFNDDFGPLNLSCVYRFNHTLMRKLKMKSLSKRKLVYYTLVNEKDGEQKKVNSAFLMGTFMLMHLNMRSESACSLLESQQSFISFRDASFKPYDYHLTLLDCLNGFKKGIEKEFFDMKTFDVLEYEHFEKVDNGDFNWIIPKQILAFCSPQSGTIREKGVVAHSPAWYVNYFKKNGVNVVVRLNESLYDPEEFQKAGLVHHDLFFPDGSTPSQSIVDKFIKICEEANTRNFAVAVHCKAGLGRTGTLIACYMMKKYKMTARESIAWIRIARPGSIIGQQQDFLDRIEKRLLSEPRSSSQDGRETPSPCSHDTKVGVLEIESGVGGMNLSRRQERKIHNMTRNKNVPLMLANTPRSHPSHSHFLRSQKNCDQSSKMQVNIENIPQDGGHNQGEAHQGEKLNSIKAGRASANGQKMRSSLKNRSRPRSNSGRRANVLRSVKKDQSFKKKCLENPPTCKCATPEPHGSPPLAARLTRSSFRI